jgi:hypothetical protein
MKKIMISITFILLMMSPYILNAFMAGNESCMAFQQGCYPGVNLQSGDTIGSLIIRGGYHSLKSSSDFISFLSLVELSESSGPEYKALQAALNSAVDNMQQAQAIYYRLKNLAAVSPYNQEVIAQLTAFDYAGFQEKRALIPGIFTKVQKFLGGGDVRGIYNRFYLNSSQLLDSLANLKRTVDANSFPDLSILWRVRQKFAETDLFSQYTAEVFYSLK